MPSAVEVLDDRMPYYERLAFLPKSNNYTPTSGVRQAAYFSAGPPPLAFDTASPEHGRRAQADREDKPSGL